jgi:uncharacterized protein
MQAKHWSAALICASLALAAPAAAQNVKAGIDAWQRGDYASAVAIWRPLAEAGDPDASFNMGQAYRLGRGVLVDMSAAQEWLERAAQKDHADAQATLGLLLFENGNQADGLKWLKLASEKGDARALLFYGTALFNGDGVAQDPVQGYAYVSRSAAQGLEPARNTLAQMDEVMPLEQRKKGVAMAVEKARTQGAGTTARPKPVAPTAKPRPAPQAPAPKSSSASPASGPWRIQLGAFSRRSSAEALFRRLSGILGGKRSYLVAAGPVTRLQVGPYPTKAAASAACGSLSARGQDCFPVAAK